LTSVQTGLDEVGGSSESERLFDATSFLDEGFDESTGSPLLGLYYALKPLLPKRAWLMARRLYAQRQSARQFPAWPIEPLLVDRLHDRFRAALADGAERVPFLHFWPDRKRFAVILTHDVEGSKGVENIPRVLEIERRHGMVSSWNFVAEEYPIPPDVFPSLRAAGCEIGVHGVRHDGSLFRSRASFDQQVPRIHQYMAEWDAVGFRSPSTHRNASWMPELRCSYDSSFPDTSPFEPQPGGCCSIWPYFIGELVELPITMAQDHTMFEVLCESTIKLWEIKSDWLIDNHGLINVLVHPDYLLSDSRLELYDQLLTRLAGRTDGWHALPRDVAAWWRARAEFQKSSPPRSAEIGGWAARATVAYARGDGEQITFELTPADRQIDVARASGA